MQAQNIINNIQQLFSTLSNKVTYENSEGLYNINKHAEYIFIPILNEIYGGVFSNTNVGRANAAMIDLLNEKKRISVQVSSTIDKTKINKTFEVKSSQQILAQFDTLIFLDIKTIAKKEITLLEAHAQKIINDIGSTCKVEVITLHTILSIIETALLQDSETWLPKVNRILTHLKILFEPGFTNPRKYWDYIHLFVRFSSEIRYPSEDDFNTPNAIWKISCINLYYQKFSSDTNRLALFASSGRGKSIAAKCIAHQLYHQNNFAIYYFDFLIKTVDDIDEFLDIFTKDFTTPYFVVFDNCHVKQANEIDELIELTNQYINNGQAKFLFCSRHDSEIRTKFKNDEIIDFEITDDDINSIINQVTINLKIREKIKELCEFEEGETTTNLRHLYNIIEQYKVDETKFLTITKQQISSQHSLSYLERSGVDKTDKKGFANYLQTIAKENALETTAVKFTADYKEYKTYLLNLEKQKLLIFDEENQGFKFIHTEDAARFLLGCGISNILATVEEYFFDKLAALTLENVNETTTVAIYNLYKNVMLQYKNTINDCTFLTKFYLWVEKEKPLSNLLFAYNIGFLHDYYFLYFLKDKTNEKLNKQTEDYIKKHFDDFCNTYALNFLNASYSITANFVGGVGMLIKNRYYFYEKAIKSDKDVIKLLDELVSQINYKSRNNERINSYLKKSYLDIYNKHAIQSLRQPPPEYKKIINKHLIGNKKFLFDYNWKSINKYSSGYASVETYLESLKVHIIKGFAFNNISLSHVGKFLSLFLDYKNNTKYSIIVKTITIAAKDFLIDNFEQITVKSTTKEICNLVNWINKFNNDSLSRSILDNKRIKNYFVAYCNKLPILSKDLNNLTLIYSPNIKYMQTELENRLKKISDDEMMVLKEFYEKGIVAIDENNGVITNSAFLELIKQHVN